MENKSTNVGLISEVLSALTTETNDSIAQSFLLVGTNGCGKTTALHEIEGRCTLLENEGTMLHPVFLSSYSLFNTVDIWVKCANALSLDDERDAFNQILVWQKNHNRRVLLLIDDLNIFLGRASVKEQYTLRGNLSRAGAPILLGTSSVIPPEIVNYDFPFFESFDVIYFPPIDSYENIIEDHRKCEQVKELMEYLPKTIRSVNIASSIVRGSKRKENNLDMLLETYSSTYAREYTLLPKQMQNILNALALQGKPSDLKTIKATAAYDDGKISPYLKLMVDRNIITSAPVGESALN